MATSCRADSLRLSSNDQHQIFPSLCRVVSLPTDRHRQLHRKILDGCRRRPWWFCLPANSVFRMGQSSLQKVRSNEWVTWFVGEEGARTDVGYTTIKQQSDTLSLMVDIVVWQLLGKAQGLMLDTQQSTNNPIHYRWWLISLLDNTWGKASGFLWSQQKAVFSVRYCSQALGYLDERQAEDV